MTTPNTLAKLAAHWNIQRVDDDHALVVADGLAGATVSIKSHSPVEMLLAALAMDILDDDARALTAQALPAAEPVTEFFAYSSGMGFERFKTKEEAIQCATDLIGYERDEAQQDQEWGDEVETICWGVVMAEAKATPEYVVEEGFPPSIDYVLEPATPQAAQQAAQAPAIPKLDTDTLRPLVARLALEIDPEADLEKFPEALAFQIDMARAVIRAALPQPPQPQSAQTTGDAS